MKTFEEWWKEEGWGNNKEFFSCAKDGWDSALKAAGIESDTPAGFQHDCEPDKVKPLAQYLDEYIQHEVENLKIGDVLAYHCACCTRELLEQALDAYESTENVTIKIERK